MPSVQTGYGPQRPLDPSAIQLTLAFLGDCELGLIEPVVTNSANYPEHTILLATDLLSTQYSGPVVVRRQPAGQGHRTLVALRPDTARSLARQLVAYANEAEVVPPDDSPHKT